MENKKTILVHLGMFTRLHNIYIIENGQMVENVQASMDTISDAVNALATRYDIKTVNIKGNKIFNKKIGNKIQEDGITQFSRDLIINYVK